MPAYLFENCNLYDGLGDTMRACWRAATSERPLFDHLLAVVNQRLAFYSGPPLLEEVPAAPAVLVELPAAPVESPVVPIVAPSVAVEERN